MLPCRVLQSVIVGHLGREAQSSLVQSTSLRLDVFFGPNARILAQMTHADLPSLLCCAARGLIEAPKRVDSKF